MLCVFVYIYIIYIYIYTYIHLCVCVHVTSVLYMILVILCFAGEKELALKEPKLAAWTRVWHGPAQEEGVLRRGASSILPYGMGAGGEGGEGEGAQISP